jgi:hypothetical protein
LKTIGTTTRIVEGVTKEAIYNIWKDINNWHKFNHGINYAKLEGEFKEGNSFILVLKNGKEVTIKLYKIEPYKSFTDVTVFPLAKMYGEHIMIENDGKIQLTSNVKIEGVLSFLWKKIVGDKVVAKLGADMDSLIALAKNG